MRILHVDSGREMRGGQWQVLYLLRGLRESGHEIRLLARPDGELLARARTEGFDAAPVSLPGLAWPRTDILHAHDARSHSRAILPGVARAPVVVSRRVAFPVRSGWASRWKYSRAAHYIAISKFVAMRLEEAGVQRDRISVVYDGVPAHAGSGTVGTRIVTLATGDPMKGADLVRQAAEGAVFSHDLAADLETASMFVYVTRSEGLGSAALLAMSRGVPVIASGVEGLREVIEDERTGLLVENTPAAIAAAIARLASDPAWARRLGEAGRERATALFSTGRMVEDTIRVYEKVRR